MDIMSFGTGEWIKFRVGAILLISSIRELSMSLKD